jgi:hypothetical protein
MRRVSSAGSIAKGQHRRRHLEKRDVASICRESNAAMVHCMTPQSLDNCIANREPPIGSREGYYTVYPRGRGASEGPKPDGYVMISRWASSEEAGSWLRNGAAALQPEIGGDRVYVTLPSAPRPAGAGLIRIDFAVPRSALFQTNNAQWLIIMQPVQNTPIHNVTITVPNGITLPK